MAGNLELSFAEAVRLRLRTSWWVLALMELELIRQFHFLISEHWAAYHRFWTKTVFGGLDRVIRRTFSDWTRFRLARVLKPERRRGLAQASGKRVGSLRSGCGAMGQALFGSGAPIGSDGPEVAVGVADVELMRAVIGVL
jgi:hypothetical protein